MILVRKKCFTYLLSLAYVILIVILLSCYPLQAEFRVCNKTSSKVGIVIGHKSHDQPWITEGWWNLHSGTCKILVSGPLVSRYYYLYAVDYDNGGEWSGPAFMCTYEKQFTIKGIENCVKRGYERTGFSEIDTGKHRSWTVNLITAVKKAEKVLN